MSFLLICKNSILEIKESIVDPDQTSQHWVSDKGLYCLPTLKSTKKEPHKEESDRSCLFHFH